MSILDKDEVETLRLSEGIVPDDQDSTVEIWKRSGAMAESQTAGGAGVDSQGFSLLTAASGPDPGWTLYNTVYGRVEQRSGREMMFGGENTALSTVNITLPFIDQTTFDLIVIDKGDQLRVLQADSSYLVHEVVSSNNGDTYGILLEVKCNLVQ